jgi:hypothetical protein
MVGPLGSIVLVIAVLGFVTAPLSSGVRDGVMHTLNLVRGGAGGTLTQLPSPKPIPAVDSPDSGPKPIHNAVLGKLLGKAWRKAREWWGRRGGRTGRRPLPLEELERTLRRRLNELNERLTTLEREAAADALRLRAYPLQPGLADEVARRTGDRVVESNRLAREHNRIQRELERVRFLQRRRSR